MVMSLWPHYLAHHVARQPASDVSHVHKCTPGGGCQYSPPDPRLPKVTGGKVCGLSLACYVMLIRIGEAIETSRGLPSQPQLVSIA